MEIFSLTENIQSCSSLEVLFFLFFSLCLQLCAPPFSPAMPWMADISAALYGGPAIADLAQQPDALIHF